MSAVDESKIEATHRLQKAGLWTKASVFRDTERRRFREQGMKRREANERAWASMIKHYPSDEFRAAVYLQAAKTPPDNCGSPEVADAWYAFFLVLMVFDIPDESVGNLAYRFAFENAPSEAVRQLLKGDRLAFFDDVKRVFGAEIERRKNDPSEINDSVADELNRYVDRLPYLCVNY